MSEVKAGQLYKVGSIDIDGQLTPAGDGQHYQFQMQSRGVSEGLGPWADGTLAMYQKAVLGALEDFENACVGYGTQETRLGSVVEQAQASRRAAQLAEIQYREGRVNFLVLLDAQRTLLQAEDELAQAETAANTSAVSVYKALGGVKG